MNRTPPPLRALGALLFATTLLALAPARAGLDLKRYGRLREAERYQMDVAEKLVKARKWAAARGEFEKFLKLYPDSVGAPYCQLMIGECYRGEKLQHTAIKEFTKVLDFWPSSPDAALAHYSIAECHWAMGDREKAIAAWDKLIEQFPKHPLCIGALWHEAEFYFRFDKPDRAVERLEKLLGSFEREREWHREWDQAWDRLFWHYVYGLDAPAAIRTAERRYGNRPQAELETGRRALRAAGDLERKKDKRAENTWKLAVSVYRQIVGAGRDHRYYREALLEVAEALAGAGEAKEAEQAYQEYLRSFPEEDGGRIRYGRFLETREQWKEATAQYLACQDKARGRWEIAEMYIRRKMVDDAVGALMAVAEKHPTKALDAYWHIARTYRHFHKWKEAAEAYKAVQAKWPQKTDDCFWELGTLYHYHMNQPAEAIKFYAQSNKEPRSLFHIADCYARQKKWDKGIETLGEVLGFFPKEAPHAQYRIADYLAKWGKKDLAIKAYMKVCDAYPRSAWARRAHDTLEFQYKTPYTGGGVGEKEK
jgi:tetratricopeptide (TPR) repeat protein